MIFYNDDQSWEFLEGTTSTDGRVYFVLKNLETADALKPFVMRSTSPIITDVYWDGERYQAKEEYIESTFYPYQVFDGSI